MKLRYLCAQVFFLLGCFALMAQTPYQASDADEDILSRELAKPGVAQAFVAGSDWLGLPEYSDRDAWRSLLGRDSALLVSQAEKLLDYEWKIIPATAYLEFERTGDRKAMERPESQNRGAMIALLRGELAEGKGRFVDQLLNGAWQATQQPTWVLSAHQSMQHSKRALPDQREAFIDLASGRYGAIMSLTWHFFHQEFDKIDPSVSLAIERAVRRNILDPFEDDSMDSVHFWMGLANKDAMLNNWNPWCNSDVLVSLFIMERDQDRLNAAVAKSVRSVDRFLNYIKKDGACEEGPGYWDAAAGKLIEYLEMMKMMSGGAFDMLSNNRILRMGEYISRAYVGDGYVANFADASARRAVGGSHVWMYGRWTGSKELENFGLYCQAKRQQGCFIYPDYFGNDSFRAVMNLRWNHCIRESVDSLNQMVQKSSVEEVMNSLRESVPSSTWYPQTEMCFMRNSSRWFLAAKGGFNNESHNHNDVGTFVLYIRDIPVFVDAGVGTYTRATFKNSERYGIWSMQCDWHNLPMPNGVSQPFGSSYLASNCACDLNKGTFSLEVAAAYPEDSGIKSCVRSYSMAPKGAAVRLSDRVILSSRTSPDVEHFLVKGSVLLPGEKFNGRLLENGEIVIICNDGLNVRMNYPKSLCPSVEIKELDDPAFTKVWGTQLCRIALTSAPNAPLKNTYSFTISEIR